MRGRLAALALAFLVLFLAPATAQETKRPVLLLFETTVGEGADKALAASSTKALRTYFRETHRVDPTIFAADSPTVLRAIMEKKLTADKVASYSSQAERIEVAKVLVFDYAAGGEVSIKDQMVTMKLWVAQVDAGKKGTFEGSAMAKAGGAAANDYGNAMQSASSAAVLDIVRKAFGQLASVPEPAPADGTETAAIGGGQPPAVEQPSAADLAAKAEASDKAGSLAEAIQQYEDAVNADPANGSLRIKLAEAYARKGLYEQAYSELGRAQLVGADKDMIDASKWRIDRMKAGEKVVEVNLPPPRKGPEESINTKIAPAIAKIVEGDKLWNQGKPDEAADAYRDSIKLNPKDWRAHERLAVVNASMSLFGEARKALDDLNAVQPDPSAKIVENRYLMFKKAVDNQFAALLRQYDSEAADFAKKNTTRESYYNTIKGLSIRLESMAKFIDAMPVPSLKQPANLRRSLACGLMAQAASSLLDYLETNNDKSKANAEVFATQAKKQLEEAVKLDANTVIVEK